MRLLSPQLFLRTTSASQQNLSIIPLILGTVFLNGCRSPETKPDFSAHETPRAPSQKPTAVKKTPKKIHSDVYFGVKTSRKVFALTFDDGPSPEWTPQVLEILKTWHASATFFMVGSMVRAHPQSARLVMAAGFPIGNHTWNHPRTTLKPEVEIDRTDQMLQSTLGIKPKLFRPPYGILDNGLAKVALDRGKTVIIWNAVGADWNKHTTAQIIASKVIRHAKAGGIALLHDGGGNRSQTVAALPYIIDGLRHRGFRMVTIPELLAMGPPVGNKSLSSIGRPPFVSPTASPTARKEEALPAPHHSG